MSEKLNRVQLFSYEDMMYRRFELTLGHYHEAHHTMAPQDIWREATSLYKQLEKSANPYDRLTLIKEQTEKDFRPNDRFLILLTLMHLLYMTLPGQDEDGTTRLMCHLAEAVYFHPWREEVMCSLWPEGCLQETADGMVCEPKTIVEEMYVFVSWAQSNCSSVISDNVKFALHEYNINREHTFDPVFDQLYKIKQKDENQHSEVTCDVSFNMESFALPKKNHPRVYDVLQKLMEATDDEGRQLFTMKSQWIAVYRILVDFLGFEDEYRDFCRRINKMGKYPIPCSENAVKRIDGIFAKPFKTWSKKLYKGRGCVYDRQYEVAKWLIEHLGIQL